MRSIRSMHRTPRTHRASCPIVRAKRALTLVNNCSCFRPPRSHAGADADAPPPTDPAAADPPPTVPPPIEPPPIERPPTVPPPTVPPPPAPPPTAPQTPAPQTPVPGTGAAPRRSQRANLGVPEQQFAATTHSGTNMDSRLGGRHEKVHAKSRAELQQELQQERERQQAEQALQREAWLHEVGTLVDQCEAIVREMPPEHAMAVRALQEAIMDLMADGESDGGSDDDEQEDPECEQCEPTEQEQMASSFFQRVASELEWTDPSGVPPEPPLAVLRASFGGCLGGLILTASQLFWVAKGRHFSQAGVRVQLSSIRELRPSLLKSPFGNRAELLFSTHEHATGSFIRIECGAQLAATEAFAGRLAGGQGALV